MLYCFIHGINMQLPEKIDAKTVYIFCDWRSRIYSERMYNDEM